ncbi:unnamed protein product [Vitrella brassicaformis CCMP3155]|uniref:subtilisin n=2 Tax=Vitrella brassicaformis TaxID=1169539 RepID=A0A0G4EBM6_VITBC|nr:unnamed protein product [Vitrella brassicaformis CCMP3155]|eukprot:CEL93039.1 unnamed protein product [Vitrella brassicaformis CCMP3155]
MAFLVVVTIVFTLWHPTLSIRPLSKFGGDQVTAEQAAIDGKLSWTLSSLIGIKEEDGGVRAPATVIRPRRRNGIDPKRRADDAGQEQVQPDGFTTFRPGDLVTADFTTKSEADASKLLADLEEMGLQNGTAFKNVVSGLLPISAVDKLPSLPELHYAQRSFVVLRGAFASLHSLDEAKGLATSQSDTAQHVDHLRMTLGLTGRGQRIGILSDSFDAATAAATSAARDIATGDLPQEGVTVLQDGHSGDKDEGRAMAQLIHDLAPAAQLSFITAHGGTAGFARNILRLAQSNDIVVDDIGYNAQPFFMDGIVAEAAQEASDMGVIYVSAAGNDGVNAYQAPFRDGGQRRVGRVSYTMHDWDPTDAVVDYQVIMLPVRGALKMVLQWSEPWFSATGGAKGSGSDIDLLLFDMDDNLLNGQTGTGIDDNIGRDAHEFLAYQSLGPDITFKLRIGLHKGRPPSLMRYLLFSDNDAVPLTYFTGSSPTIYGHPNAPGAISCAAAYYADTPRFGQFTTALAEPFTSHGGTPILFNKQGEPVHEIRKKPDVSAADGAHTTFLGKLPGDNPQWPNFFGTSAAAPHVAAVAALLKEWQPDLTPAQVWDVLTSTAHDMNDNIKHTHFGQGDFSVGRDNQTGYGLVDAFAAAVSLADIPVCLTKAAVDERACTATDTSPCVGTADDDSLVVAVSDEGGNVVTDGQDGNDCLHVTVDSTSSTSTVRVLGGNGRDYIVIDGTLPALVTLEVRGAPRLTGEDDRQRDTILLTISAKSETHGVHVFVEDSGSGTPDLADIILGFGFNTDESCRADVLTVSSPRASATLSYDDHTGEVRAGKSLAAMINPPLPSNAIIIDGADFKRNCATSVPPLQRRPPVEMPPSWRFVGEEELPFIALEPGTRQLPIPGCPLSLLEPTHSRFVTNMIPNGPQAICGKRVTFQSHLLDGPLPVFDLSCDAPNKSSLAQRLFLVELDQPTHLDVTYHNSKSKQHTGVFVYRGCETGMAREPSVWRGEIWHDQTRGINTLPIYLPEAGFYAVLVSNICEIGFETDITITCPDDGGSGSGGIIVSVQSADDGFLNGDST